MKNYSYNKSLKTGSGRAFFNINSLLTIPAPLVVKSLFNTPVTPHQVIVASLIIGILSGYLLSLPHYGYTVAGILLLLLKNLLDKVDGQLARARNQGSRLGRFLDSVSDFFVNLAVYAGMTVHLYREEPGISTVLLGAGAFIASLIHCTFFVYYQVSYVNLVNPQGLNRTNERLTGDDIASADTPEGKRTLLLQKMYLVIYGWQDAFIRVVDVLLFNRFSKKHPDHDCESIWYRGMLFLSFASFLGLGTQIGIISVLALFKSVDYYFLYTIVPATLYMFLLFAVRYISADIIAGRLN